MKEFKKRWTARQGELLTLWEELYKNRDIQPLYDLLQSKFKARKPSLKSLDAERIANPLWYLGSKMSGMMLYVDKFNKTFGGLEQKLPYLESLDVRYLHLMPCKIGRAHV